MSDSGTPLPHSWCPNCGRFHAQTRDEEHARLLAAAREVTEAFDPDEWYEEYRSCQYGWCVSCGADVNGAYGSVTIESVVHEDDCSALKMSRAIRALAEAVGEQDRSNTQEASHGS